MSAVRIPADVDRPDRLIANLTARQVAILAGTALVLYTAWTLARTLVPLPMFLLAAVPVGVTAAVLALGQRDGITLDRLLLAAIAHHLTPTRRVAAAEGIGPAPDWLTARATPSDRSPAGPGDRLVGLRLPAEGVTETGVLDLGTDGLAVVAVASTVNFALRTPAEQDSLVGGFGRYLHSLTAPVQILVRTERLDLSAQITDLRDRAGSLAHPALETAALEHADYLADLASQTDLLRRQVLLILREPLGSAGPVAGREIGRWGWGRESPQRAHAAAAERRAAESRLVRRLAEVVDLLAPAGIVITPLDAGQATAVLAAACAPDTLVPPSTDLAGVGDVITTPHGPADEPPGSGDGVAVPDRRRDG